MVVGGWITCHPDNLPYCHEDPSLVLGEVGKILVCYRIAIAGNFTYVKVGQDNNKKDAHLHIYMASERCVGDSNYKKIGNGYLFPFL